MRTLAAVWDSSFVETYEIRGLRWLLASIGFVALAVGLPYLCHQFSIAGVVFLPLHFSVLLAAMTVGPLAGMITAIGAPWLSFALSGMPPLPFLPAMNIELLAYAAVTGILVHRFRTKPWVALLLALILGRLLAITLGLIGFAPTALLTDRLRTLFFVGLPGVGLQLALVPVLSKWSRTWLGSKSKNDLHA